MATWRFYQGLRTEWRWYHFDNKGAVIAQCDQGFAELRGCMANAESAGFKGDAYQVHTRTPTEDILPVGAVREPTPEPVAALAAASQGDGEAPAA